MRNLILDEFAHLLFLLNYCILDHLRSRSTWPHTLRILWHSSHLVLVNHILRTSWATLGASIVRHSTSWILLLLAWCCTLRSSRTTHCCSSGHHRLLLHVTSCHWLSLIRHHWHLWLWLRLTLGHGLPLSDLNLVDHTLRRLTPHWHRISRHHHTLLHLRMWGASTLPFSVHSILICHILKLKKLIIKQFWELL